MKVDILLFNEKSVVPYKKNERDFCYDCVATSCKELAPNVYEYGLGIGLQIQDTQKEKRIPCIDLRPKGGIWKTGMVLSNGPGTVDEPYTGELTAVFYHLMTNMPKYEVGDKICQIRISFTEEMEFNVVKEFPKTSRGAGKHGSTGVKHDYKEGTDTSKVFDEVKGIFKDWWESGWNLKNEEVTCDTKFGDIGMDSLDFVEFIMQVENKMNIALPDQDIEEIKTFGQLVSLITNKLNKK